MYDSTRGMFFMPQRSDAWTLQGLESWQGDKAPRGKYSLACQLSRVVKDNSQRVAMASTDPTHPVAHLHAIIAACSRDRSVVDSEDHGIALAQGQDFGAGLHARPLFGQDEFAAVEIFARRGEQHRHLEREDMRAIKVLVEAVIIASAILEKLGRRPCLTCSMATRQKGILFVRKTRFQPHAFVPAIGDGCEVRIERHPQFLDQRWQGVGEIAILAAPETVALHHDVAPESDGWLIESRKVVALA